MITKTEEIQAEIIVAIQDSFSAYKGEGFKYSQQEILDYLEECFAAKNKLALLKEHMESIPCPQSGSAPEFTRRQWEYVRRKFLENI